MPPTRSRKNTAAASVELTMAPVSSDSYQPKPKASRAATATSPAVSSTPAVARVRAGAAAARKLCSRVSKPLSNRISARATLPMK
ncbi:Uncharacterised protein [Mycobacteroides abscessus subsp. massiliense]|nr:Uncharacterised protein [Mycobacteroides abscessus subsp. massiliense]